ncbi:hypothetical protein IKL45_00710 [Candidatus Saccharibacteria bacterium]|nr:hypothetical protein [Candidatus Saccharibacteria bacterium]MBR6122954.1 hypothetical protein [Candidatus Saccharibacteria bacterium]
MKLAKLKSFVSLCIKWRYLIALVVFIICVIFKLHGSSIGVYNNMFANAPQHNSEQNIVGKSREIRSDEFLVHTPYYMSQAYNDYAKSSDMMSLEGQDMIVGYNAPVLDVSIIAKPFTWGYVLLGNEYGLSWYWCMKLILLVLVSFELCMIITQNNKKVSLLGALLVSFSPLVQWWFVPHIVDVFFWGMSLLVLAYHFFTAKSPKYKITFSILLPLSAITFVLALFPSLQLSVGLSALALLIAFLIRDKKQITFRKKDWWQIAVMAIFALAVLGYTLYTSKDAITALMNTAYPGKRVSLGGANTLEDLFTNLVTFTLPFKQISYSNNCEVSNFIHFAPLILMLYPALRKKLSKDKTMIVGKAFVICIAVMSVFMLAGFPELLAKITGFSYINRMDQAYGLIATLFTIWGIDAIWRNPSILSHKRIICTVILFAASYIFFIDAKKLTYLELWQYLIIIAGLATLAYLMLKNAPKTRAFFITGATLLILISGCTINPMAHGTSALTSHPLEQKISELAQSDPEAYWLAVGDIKLSALTITNGAKTLNAVNFYPDFAKWKILDPEGKYRDIYNRYAHIAVKMTSGDTQFLEGATADTFTLLLNYEDSLKWPVEYLVVAGELYDESDFYDKIYDDPEGNYHIYQKVTDAKNQ